MKNTPHWFRKNSKLHLPDIDPGEIMSLLLIRLGKGCYVDVIKLDRELEKKHGKIPDGVSTADFIADHYGNDAMEWVRDAL